MYRDISQLLKERNQLGLKLATNYICKQEKMITWQCL